MVLHSERGVGRQWVHDLYYIIAVSPFIHRFESDFTTDHGASSDLLCSHQ